MMTTLLIHPTRNLTADERRELEEDIVEALGNGPWRVPWPLPNMKPVTEEEYWSYRTSYTPQATVYGDRIEFKPRGGKYGNPMWGSLMLDWHDRSYLMGGGYAVVHSHNAADHGERAVHYFEWSACDHKWSEKTIRHCVHEVTCAKCGSKFDYDSSG